MDDTLRRPGVQLPRTAAAPRTRAGTATKPGTGEAAAGAGEAERVAIVGLGYVGLPLAVEFGRTRPTVGFDVRAERIASLGRGVDPGADISPEQLRASKHLKLSSDLSTLADADFIIVAVPTPVDSAHRPELEPLRAASRQIGSVMKPGATVIFESTVYPGATEEVCIPVLESASGRKWKTDFHVGYSPERINPGDKERTLTKVVKIVSGDSPQTLERIARLYESIIAAGVHRVSSIKVAEAAKVIENTQRDLNIALMNELAIIFNQLHIDTLEVLEAAGTKWNFLPFRPGLVGGHCIGVDPYYLTHKAEAVGYHPQVILAGRRINDGMGRHVAVQTVKQMVARGRKVSGADVNVLGLTFKENCPDLRNSKVVDMIEELRSFGIRVFVHDPVADPAEARHEYGLELTPWDALPVADATIVAVSHRELVERPLDDFIGKTHPGGCFIDVKARFDAGALRAAGLAVWRL
jgi:UDP-N-acetyl-D-galactosamine dehydrogenase